MLEGVNPVAKALGEGDQPETDSKNDGTGYARILKFESKSDSYAITKLPKISELSQSLL